ncbi:MAG: hypothetical protein ACI4Q3_05380 [Kiritimatiellia bacterium]
MSLFASSLWRVIMKASPYWGMFLAALLASLALTPLCREAARRLGMVDRPSARRINKTPIPRAGGLAVFLALGVSLLVGEWLFADCLRESAVLAPRNAFRMFVLGGLLCLLGLLDDRFSLPPLVKLLGQIAVALGAVFWCGVGFHTVIPGLPAAVDCALTLFWIVGAVNAFNLIDGLDGLATGLACIASIGMVGALCFVGHPENALVLFAFVGACLGFLHYNFHPASVFLGDTGSMFIGFTLATLPLLAGSTNSLFVGVGVPILAMGVPILDTSLAIVRRVIRAALRRKTADPAAGEPHVMQPDTDHLHHRILRRLSSQRKAALALYGVAVLFVAIGLGGLALEGRAVSLYIVGFVVAVVVIFRDMRRIELWDAGRLLNSIAHDRTLASCRRFHVLKVPMLMTFDFFVLVVAWLLTTLALSLPISGQIIHRWLPLRVVPIFLCLVFSRTYTTVWSRAVLSNYVRLAAAVVVGTALTASVVAGLDFPHSHLLVFSLLYALLVLAGLVSVRTLRAVVRDLFYALDADRLADLADTRRIVVYGSGLRYRSFRRELVRSSASGHRVIVGLLDDDVLLRGQYIGGVRIYGTLEQAPSILQQLRADAVVVACKLTDRRLEVARQMFARCGIEATIWTCEETAL